MGRRGDNINVITEGREFEGVCWIHLSQDWVQLLSL